MVAGTTVQESITIDIIEKLEEIDGPPDYSAALTVYRMGANIMGVPRLPCAIVLDVGADEDDGAANGTIQCTRRFDIILGVSSYDSGWPADVQAACADVAAKLREDWTRGGIAQTTRVDFEDIWDAPADGEMPVAGGHVSVTVVYRHLYDDPTFAV